MGKKIYWIRHGEGKHNVLFRKIGEEAFIKCEDAELTQVGIDQAKRANKKMKKIQIDLIIVSPLTRTLETASLIFGQNTPMISYDEFLEHPQGVHLCNRRKKRSELMKKYPNVDFKIKEVPKWQDHYETQSELKKRVKKGKAILKKSKEMNIAVVCHNSYIKCALGFDLEGEIEHCHPYEEDL